MIREFGIPCPFRGRLALRLGVGRDGAQRIPPYRAGDTPRREPVAPVDCPVAIDVSPFARLASAFCFVAYLLYISSGRRQVRV